MKIKIMIKKNPINIFIANKIKYLLLYPFVFGVEFVIGI